MELIPWKRTGLVMAGIWTQQLLTQILLLLTVTGIFPSRASKVSFPTATGSFLMAGSEDAQQESYTNGTEISVKSPPFAANTSMSATPSTSIAIISSMSSALNDENKAKAMFAFLATSRDKIPDDSITDYRNYTTSEHPHQTLFQEQNNQNLRTREYLHFTTTEEAMLADGHHSAAAAATVNSSPFVTKNNQTKYNNFSFVEDDNEQSRTSAEPGTTLIALTPFSFKTILGKSKRSKDTNVTASVTVGQQFAGDMATTLSPLMLHFPLFADYEVTTAKYANRSTLKNKQPKTRLNAIVTEESRTKEDVITASIIETMNSTEDDVLRESYTQFDISSSGYIAACPKHCECFVLSSRVKCLGPWILDETDQQKATKDNQINVTRNANDWQQQNSDQNRANQFLLFQIRELELLDFIIPVFNVSHLMRTIEDNFVIKTTHERQNFFPNTSTSNSLLQEKDLNISLIPDASKGQHRNLIHVVYNPHSPNSPVEIYIGEGRRQQYRKLVSVRELTVKNCSTEKLTTKTLAALPSLQRLDFSNNRLTYISSETFFGVKQLIRLDLSKNFINNISRTFEHLLSLEVLILQENKITSLDKDSFVGLGSITYLNLAQNLISSVDIAAFQHLKSLNTLVLNDNPLSNLLRLNFFGSKLQFIDVSNINISKIPQVITQSIRNLRASGNSFRVIQRGDLDPYPYLRELDLEQNGLEVLEEDALGRHEYLTRLFMGNNDLKFVPQSLPISLVELFLQMNQIAALRDGDFRGLSSLEQLFLFDNRISYVSDSALSDLVNLKTLNLRTNRIQTFGSDIFANLTKLASLDLSENPIVSIGGSVFSGLHHLKVLHLSSIVSSDLALSIDAFSPLVRLEVLNLDFSPILCQKVVNSSNLLNSLPALREIYLVRCDTTSVSIDFKNYLPRIEEIRLSERKNNTIDHKYHLSPKSRKGTKRSLQETDHEIENRRYQGHSGYRAAATNGQRQLHRRQQWRKILRRADYGNVDTVELTTSTPEALNVEEGHKNVINVSSEQVNGKQFSSTYNDSKQAGMINSNFTVHAELLLPDNNETKSKEISFMTIKNATVASSAMLSPKMEINARESVAAPGTNDHNIGVMSIGNAFKYNDTPVIYADISDQLPVSVEMSHRVNSSALYFDKTNSTTDNINNQSLNSVSLNCSVDTVTNGPLPPEMTQSLLENPSEAFSSRLMSTTTNETKDILSNDNKRTEIYDSNLIWDSEQRDDPLGVPQTGVFSTPMTYSEGRVSSVGQNKKDGINVWPNQAKGNVVYSWHANTSRFQASNGKDASKSDQLIFVNSSVNGGHEQRGHFKGKKRYHSLLGKIKTDDLGKTYEEEAGDWIQVHPTWGSSYEEIEEDEKHVHKIVRKQMRPEDATKLTANEKKSKQLSNSAQELNMYQTTPANLNEQSIPITNSPTNTAPMKNTEFDFNSENQHPDIQVIEQKIDMPDAVPHFKRMNSTPAGNNATAHNVSKSHENEEHKIHKDMYLFRGDSRHDIHNILKHAKHDEDSSLAPGYVEEVDSHTHFNKIFYFFDHRKALSLGITFTATVLVFISFGAMFLFAIIKIKFGMNQIFANRLYRGTAAVGERLSRSNSLNCEESPRRESVSSRRSIDSSQPLTSQRHQHSSLIKSSSFPNSAKKHSSSTTTPRKLLSGALMTAKMSRIKKSEEIRAALIDNVGMGEYEGCVGTMTPSMLLSSNSLKDDAGPPISKPVIITTKTDFNCVMASTPTANCDYDKGVFGITNLTTQRITSTSCENDDVCFYLDFPSDVTSPNVPMKSCQECENLAMSDQHLAHDDGSYRSSPQLSYESSNAGEYDLMNNTLDSPATPPPPPPPAALQRYQHSHHFEGNLYYPEQCKREFASSKSDTHRCEECARKESSRSNPRHQYCRHHQLQSSCSCNKRCQNKGSAECGNDFPVENGSFARDFNAADRTLNLFESGDSRCLSDCGSVCAQDDFLFSNVTPRTARCSSFTSSSRHRVYTLDNETDERKSLSHRIFSNDRRSSSPHIKESYDNVSSDDRFVDFDTKSFQDSLTRSFGKH